MPIGEDRPLARSNELIVEEIGDEVLIYDTKTDHGHSLSPEAAKVWRSCDGTTSAEELSARLGLDAGTVERALDELSGCELLEVSPTIVADGSTRREVTLRLAKVGAAAAVAPLILSVAAPSAQAVGTGFCRKFSSQNCGCDASSGGCCASVGCCCCAQAGAKGIKLCVPQDQQGLCPNPAVGCSSGGGTTTTTAGPANTTNTGSTGLGSAAGPSGGIGSGIGQ